MPPCESPHGGQLHSLGSRLRLKIKASIVLIKSRLYYCNSLFITLQKNLSKLQRMYRIFEHGWYVTPPFSHHHYHQLYANLNLNWLHIILFLPNNAHIQVICYMYLASLGHLDHPFPKQRFVHKTMLIISKRAFSVTAPTINSLLRLNFQKRYTPFVRSLKHICVKLLFHHNIPAVPCCNEDFCLSQCMTS